MLSVNLNSRIVNPAPSTTARQLEFIAAISEPEISELLSPYMLGVLDAEKGELCVPEMYYTRKGEQREYAQGFEAVAGRTLLSDQVMGRKREMSDDEIAAEAEAYADDIADREYHARGQW